MPSARTPRDASWTWPRPWGIPTRFSVRVWIHVTARPSRRATAATTTVSADASNLPPNPPPTRGATTRTRPGSRRRLAAMASRTWCTRWVEAHTVTPSAVGSARHPSGSMGALATRWLTKRPRTTRFAPARGSWSSPIRRSNTTLVPRSGKSSASEPASAASTPMTAGRGSMATTTSSAASTARARVSATTTATGSPTKRTRSVARGGRARPASRAAWAGTGARPSSSAPSTATTPGAPRAASASSDRISPCASVARTNTAWSVAGPRSATYRPRPRSSSSSSRRGTIRPMPSRPSRLPTATWLVNSARARARSGPGWPSRRLGRWRGSAPSAGGDGQRPRHRRRRPLR